jgi:tRNA-2-methylthio-N6-dimethylallyladenosine synthase
MTLSTDFIVGFPGETDEDFEDTLRVLDEVAFDGSFSFILAPALFCPLRLKDDLPMVENQPDCHTSSNARPSSPGLATGGSWAGEIPVRIETHGPNEQGWWLARSGEWKTVHLAAGRAANCLRRTRAGEDHPGQSAFLGAEVV